MQVVYLTFFPEKRVKEKYDTHMRTEGTLSSQLKVPPDSPICCKVINKRDCVHITFAL